MHQCLGTAGPVIGGQECCKKKEQQEEKSKIQRAKGDEEGASKGLKTGAYKISHITLLFLAYGLVIHIEQA